MQREAIVFYKSFDEAISLLSDDDQLEAYRAITRYGLYGEEPEITGAAGAIFLLAKPQIDANNRRYENGNRGGRPKKTGANQTETKQKPKQNQTETKRKPKEKEKEKEKEKDIYISTPNGVVSAEPTPYHEIVALYHQCCTTMPKVKAISKTRQAAMRNLYNEYGIDGFEDVFAKAGASDFLTGRTGKWNGCGFDWLIKPANFLKVLEGTYDNSKKARDFNNATERSYDFDDLELKLIATN